DTCTRARGMPGALKISPRLPLGSELEEASGRCGYLPYLREWVYRRPVDASETHAVPAGLRRRGKEDLYPVFQQYSAIVPSPVRQREGMTLGEWTAARESLGRTTQYVIERDGRIAGSLRVAGDGDIGRFDLLGDEGAVDDLIEAAMAKVA